MTTTYVPPPIPPPQEAYPSTDATQATPSQAAYAPPPYPPPRSPLLFPSSPQPYNLDLEELAVKGFVRLNVEPSDPLYEAFAKLLEASSRFFNLDEPTKQKYFIPVHLRSQQSEEGYSNIPGEKSMITLRRMATTPTECMVRERTQEAWRVAGEVMGKILTVIEESLCMNPRVLTRLMGPDNVVPFPAEGQESVATLLRMFRYERPTSSTTAEGQEKAAPVTKVVAEQHRDLGLLTIVVGHTPGLECLDPLTGQWVSCEEPLAGEDATPGRLRVSLLVGQTLAKFTNWRYVAGRHRVLVHPLSLSTNFTKGSDDPLHNPAHRFSLVYALRGHLPLTVSSYDFETAITGLVPSNLEFENMSIGKIYDAISKAHFNINVVHEDRKTRERELAEKVAGKGKDKAAAAPSQAGENDAGEVM